MSSIDTQSVEFQSDGLTLRGVLHIPSDASAEAPRSAFIILHGFGGTYEGHDAKVVAALLNELGYVTLLFNFRGCGNSDGPRGRIICLEQVRDAQNAITFLQSRPDIAADRIALAGSSFGAAVAVYAGGIDRRVAAVMSNAGWGDGERKLRGQHSTPEQWQEFERMLKSGAEHKARTGESLMVSRFAIVPIPTHLRKGLPSDSIMSFPTDTARSMLEFRPDDVIGSIAPRPLLLTHAAFDTVTPTDESMELFRRADTPSDLYIFADIDHFNTYHDERVRTVVKAWLERYFPASTRLKSPV